MQPGTGVYFSCGLEPPSLTMRLPSNRRNFLKASAAATLAAPLIISLEEYALARESSSTNPPSTSVLRATVPMGKIGEVKISRVICGGNLISGYAHSRDLIYV